MFILTVIATFLVSYPGRKIRFYTECLFYGVWDIIGMCVGISLISLMILDSLISGPRNANRWFRYLWPRL